MRVSPYPIRVLALSSWYSVAPKIYIFGSNYAKKGTCFHRNGKGQSTFAEISHVSNSGINAANSLPVVELNRHFEDWLIECGFLQHSERTIEFRRGRRLLERRRA